MGVGEVLQFYDSDRHFPAWGFGGRTIDGSVSHCFNLNGMASECEVRASKFNVFIPFVIQYIVLP